MIRSLIPSLCILLKANGQNRTLRQPQAVAIRREDCSTPWNGLPPLFTRQSAELRRSAGINCTAKKDLQRARGVLEPFKVFLHRSDLLSNSEFRRQKEFSLLYFEVILASDEGDVRRRRERQHQREIERYQRREANFTFNILLLLCLAN